MTYRDDRGSMSLLAAAVIVVIGFAMFAIADLTLVLSARSRAQTAADAAALAAARELAVPSGTAPADAAADYAGRNGATLVSCQCAAGSPDAVVEVAVAVKGTLVLPERTVTAEARADVAIPPPDG